MNNLLTSRTFNTAGLKGLPDNWYTPEKYLQSFKSVKKTELYDTCSSAGDWSGYFIQKIGKVNYVILFSQENNYPRGGFTITTSNVVASGQCDFSEADINQILAVELGW